MDTAHHISVVKLDPQGQPTIRYPGEIVYADEEVLVARCLWSQSYPFDLGPFVIEPGDIFMEYYYPGEWFNVFAIHEHTGVLKGWYCNITYAVEIADGEVRWRDLALDYLVLPDGQSLILDRAEFEALPLPAEVRARAEEALKRLQGWVTMGHYPFSG